MTVAGPLLPFVNTFCGLPTKSIGSFRATSQRIHGAVMAEFEGSLVDESVEVEAAQDEVVAPDPDMSSGTTGAGRVPATGSKITQT